jgi:hypothetical protein
MRLANKDRLGLPHASYRVKKFFKKCRVTVIAPAAIDQGLFIVKSIRFQADA